MKLRTVVVVPLLSYCCCLAAVVVPLLNYCCCLTAVALPLLSHRCCLTPVPGRIIAQATIPKGKRVLQTSQPIQLGTFADTRFGLHGSLAHVMVLKATVSTEQLKYALQVWSPPSRRRVHRSTASRAASHPLVVNPRLPSCSPRRGCCTSKPPSWTCGRLRRLRSGRHWRSY